MGKIPNLTNIFQRGWNHQLEKEEQEKLKEPWMNEDSVMVLETGGNQQLSKTESSWKPTTHLTYFDVFSLSTKTQETYWTPIHLFVQLPNLFWGWAVQLNKRLPLSGPIFAAWICCSRRWEAFWILSSQEVR